MITRRRLVLTLGAGALATPFMAIAQPRRRIYRIGVLGLKGAQPAELAIEVPAQYELAINQKTARALGVNFPPAILQKADRLAG